MKTHKQVLDEFYNIAKLTYFTGQSTSEITLEEFIVYLMHSPLNEREHNLVEYHRLYDWLFPYYYTEEEQQILTLFSQMASERKTAIYGTGAIACLLLNCGCYEQIAGIMALRQPGTMFCGKEILGEVQLIQDGITQIVVAAKVRNYQVITERIADFCQDNGILLKGANGRNLIQWYGVKNMRVNRVDRNYFALESQKLRKEIDNHDAISFDVFDTLVMRKVLQPTDVFYIVGQKAKKIGILPTEFAEKRKQADWYNRYEKNIFGIYHTLQDMLMLTDADRDALMDLEIETERNMLVCRQEVVKCFQYALLQGKRVFLISDMYLPEIVMGSLLAELGIKGYEKLLVSCDYHSSKTTGLFHIYRDMVSGERCLHIGDNELADGAAFEKEGIDVFLIRSAFSLLQISNLKALMGFAYSMKEQNALGLLLSDVFNDPFAFHVGQGVMQVGTYREWGYRFLGMYVTAYFDWLVRQLKESRIHKMLFSTRDGYLFYHLYNWYRENIDGELPEAVYFKTSRKICYLASLLDEEHIDFYLKYDDVYEPQELLEKRFLINIADTVPCDGMDRREYIMLHKDKIYKKATMIRKQYLSYMRENGLREGMEYGFFDSYCRGTVQYLLEQFVPFDLHGLYLGKIHNTLKLKKVQSFYEDKGDYLRLDDINEKRTLMEYCFSSPEANIIGMADDGKFLYANEYRTDRDIRHMLDIQEGGRNFFITYYSSFPSGEEAFGGSLPNAVINTMDLVDLTGECHDIGRIRSVDDMVNKGYAVWNT